MERGPSELKAESAFFDTRIYAWSAYALAKKAAGR